MSTLINERQTAKSHGSKWLYLSATKWQEFYTTKERLPGKEIRVQLGATPDKSLSQEKGQADQRGKLERVTGVERMAVYSRVGKSNWVKEEQKQSERKKANRRKKELHYATILLKGPPVWTGITSSTPSQSAPKLPNLALFHIHSCFLFFFHLINRPTMIFLTCSSLHYVAIKSI